MNEFALNLSTEHSMAALRDAIGSLEPRLAALMIAFKEGLVVAPLSDWATEAEIEQIRRLARRLCEANGYRMQALWGHYRRHHYLDKCRRAFGKVPRSAVELIVRDLRARLEGDIEPDPLVVRMAIRQVGRPNRHANPETDFNANQVAEILAADGFAVEPELLSSALGLYDTLDIKPLYCRGRSPRSGTKEPYLDQPRVDFLRDRFRNHGSSIEYTLMYIRTLPLQDREDLKASRPLRRVRFAAIFRGV